MQGLQADNLVKWSDTSTIQPHYKPKRTYAPTWSMLLMNVCGAVHRGVSSTKTMAVGSTVAKASVIMAPEADQVKISI